MKRRLEAFVRDHTRREKELERDRVRLRRERDKEIRGAYKDGLPLEEIALIFGLSHQHISRIVRKRKRD